MKKIGLIVVLTAIVMSMATAQVGLSVGAKGTLLLPVGTERGSDVNKMLESSGVKSENITDNFSVGGGGAIYGRYDIPVSLPAGILGAQLEVGFMANNGGTFTVSEETTKFEMESGIFYNSVELPVLVTYQLPVTDMICVNLGLGPNMSFPFGAKAKSKMTMPGLNVETEEDVTLASPVIVGLAVGAGVGVKAGPGSVIGDVRFINDFMPIMGESSGKEDYEFSLRRGLTISAGYEMMF